MVPRLEKPFELAFRAMNRMPRGKVQEVGALLKVFWPYITYDTVFDSSRAAEEVGSAPPPFTSYCLPLLDFVRTNRFRYPYREWPDAPASSASPSGRSLLK